MMVAMTYSDDCYNCGSDDGGDDPVFMVMTIMVMGMITMMMVGMTLFTLIYAIRLSI